MKSNTRIECEAAVTQFADYINTKKENGTLLYVGIAGDPPGGEYAPLFKKFNIKTFDIGERWSPDILGDITKTQFEDASWDIIVCVQTIEHIPNIWDLPEELKRILKPGGYAIVDCPWSYPYHGEPEFGDYWRISKDGMKSLFEPALKLTGLYEGQNNTSCLFTKV
jgi:SAM-dependent methyltransferase